MIEKMLLWYASESGGKAPDHLAEDTKVYGGKVLRWLEPLLPGVENPCLIEQFEGDSWTLQIRPVVRKITNLVSK